MKIVLWPARSRRWRSRHFSEDDEQPGRAKIDRIPSLRPAFKADGTITAANASSISDGASALVLASADALGDREPLAKVVGHATHSIHPSEFTLAPIGAIQKLADKIGWDLDSVDLFEINEAFAMVTMLTVQELVFRYQAGQRFWWGLRSGSSYWLYRQPLS
ncbi:MAG: hypothetical protein CM15mP120_27820 [Pseudomonadota bacterium]|nr:MAG: hypothetical protein CM15mP120_27820 [Pseudomonadota bacterium]